MASVFHLPVVVFSAVHHCAGACTMCLCRTDLTIHNQTQIMSSSYAFSDYRLLIFISTILKFGWFDWFDWEIAFYSSLEGLVCYGSTLLYTDNFILQWAQSNSLNDLFYTPPARNFSLTGRLRNKTSLNPRWKELSVFMKTGLCRNPLILLSVTTAEFCLSIYCDVKQTNWCGSHSCPNSWGDLMTTGGL